MTEYYVGFYQGSSDKVKFLSTLYRNSTSTTTDMGDAFICETLEQAKIVVQLAKNRENCTWQVFCVETKVSCLGEGDE